jgi:putative transcriptional regulator
MSTMPQDPFRAGRGSLEGQILIAMPSIGDPRFERSLVFVCAHSEQGAMGFVVNKLIEQVTLPELLRQLEIRSDRVPADTPVYFGGPVEVGRGFVLHSDDYVLDNVTLPLGPGLCLTASIEILQAIAEGGGPEHRLFVLGYAGWAPGQLESELQANGWLHCPADEDLVFGPDLGGKWARALGKLGIDIVKLSGQAGHA